MKTAILYALGMVLAVLLTRRTLAAPGVELGAGGWVSWPLDDASAGQGEQGEPWISWPLQGADDAYQVQGQGDTVPDQLPGAFAATVASIGASMQALPQVLGITPEPGPDLAARNEAAFLDMIAYAEGTAGPDGYRTMFGGGLFDSFADHPRVYHNFRDGAGRDLRTSAAGRYQFLAKTWDALRARLNLPDFGPAAQDVAAIELVRERGALGDVRAGRVAAAVAKVAPIWASLPGANYAQPERKLSALLASYTAAGGNLEA